MQANVFDFGRTASRIRAVEHRARSARTEERALREDVVRSAREAYLAWTVAYARVALAERHQEDGRKRAAMVAGAIAEGGRPRADLNAARQDEVALEMEVAGARAGLDHARGALEQVAGATWSDSAVPDLGLLETPAIGDSIDARLASAALEQKADAATAVAESFAHEHAPFVSTSAEAGVRGQATSMFPAYRVGITVTVPLWDGGLASAQAQSARAQAESLRSEAVAARKAREGALRARPGATAARQAPPRPGPTGAGSGGGATAARRRGSPGGLRCARARVACRSPGARGQGGPDNRLVANSTIRPFQS
jgi:outer membrane protein TolC